ncbi:MAG: FAD-binding protein [Anaerolineaceae bacterium]|nr:FAD-binding protein [Anaerolineaceae bacterium]
MQNELKWPYRSEISEYEQISADVLVLGGGIAGCMAAIAAARKGQKVVLVEKGGTKRSGAGGSGCDHWESATTNPCSGVSPEELVNAMLDDNDGYNNAISHYIECREGWDRMLDIEQMGGKIRDTEDEFIGADFRDEATKLLFAYDYKNRFTLRIWGTTFKPAMEKELKRLGVTILDRVMVTSLLTKDGKNGTECIGATGLHTRTGKFYVLSGKANIIAMSRPARVWLFSAAYPGLCEFRPLQCIGDGHAMGWRVGAEFNMMEKSVRAEFSAAGRSYPPYSAGNNHNTWYPASLVDANSREIPYADRDGNILPDVKSRFYPAKGQHYFLKGGNIEQAKYDYEGPETLPYAQLKEMGYKLPFYADLTNLPELERKAIWGLMVGQEGKTNVPVLKNYTDAGFDPTKHVLQCYGVGWTSAEFLPQERQLFGLPGGFMNDWKLQTNLPGLFVAGDSLFSSNCYGHAAATGYYAGRHAADYASSKEIIVPPHIPQVEAEKQRVYAPLHLQTQDSVSWKELNEAISKTMQNYCSEIKCDELLNSGIEQLSRFERDIIPRTSAANPHELMRLLEVFDILTVAQIILQASLARKQNCKKLEFFRSDEDDQKQKPFIVIRHDGEKVIQKEVSLDYAGDIKMNYEKFNAEYVEEIA